MKRPQILMDSTEDLPNKVLLVERNPLPQGIPLVDANAVTKVPKDDLLALVTEIQKADTYIKANACTKLRVIAEQMRFLQKQAESILLEAKQNTKLHHAACNFLKQPGHVYHLYKRESGQYYFSMLSPEEWGDSGPSQSYEGSYRLEQDHSWTPLSQAAQRDNETVIIEKLFNADISISLDSIKTDSSNLLALK